VPIAQFLQAAWPYLIVLAPGAYALWRSFQGDRRQTRRQRADLIRIAQDAAASVIESLRQRVDDLEKELADLKDERLSMMHEHAQALATKDRQIALLEGHARQLQATIQSYDRLLTKHDIPHPAPALYWEPGAEPVILQPSAPS
jgi:hypothetical protein